MQSTPNSPQATTPGGAAIPAAQAPELLTPPIERFATHYERYNGAIGQGANKTTHTAEVRFTNTIRGLAVVKAFSLNDEGWLNESIAWTLGRAIGLALPPKAVLLVAKPEDLAAAPEAELALAHSTLAGAGPVVFWCASRLDTKPPQQMLSMSWETVVLRGKAGQELAAFDGWLGNCDRIDDNAPYWTARGVIAAIDHERLAFNQDWLASAPLHLDRLGAAKTKLLERLHHAQANGTFRPKQAKEIVAGPSTHEHRSRQTLRDRQSRH